MIYSPIPRVARAHWTIYLPSGVVALVWAAIYGWAAAHEPQLGALKALALAVEALGVPLLLFFAAVRARVLSVEVRGDGVLSMRFGFLRPREVSIGLHEIASVRVRRSFVQALLGGGALDVKTLSGERLFVTDLDHPDDIAAALVVPVRDDFGHTDTLH
ncbi:MAG: PH domain-containing protein [Parvibaculum sp.]|nr:PH domain-containing protein [Parvibaculum sp.]